MNKYYHQEVYRLESGQIFEDLETMREYVRDNWETYCRPVGDEVSLISMQDTNSRLILDYREREIEDGVTYSETHSSQWIDYETVTLTWLISKLERMTANV